MRIHKHDILGPPLPQLDRLGIEVARPLGNITVRDGVCERLEHLIPLRAVSLAEVEGFEEEFALKVDGVGDESEPALGDALEAQDVAAREVEED